MLGEKCFLLGLIIQSLRCHHDDLIVEFKKFEEELKIIALTETWLTKIDTEPVKQSKMGIANLKKDYSIANFHPLLSKPRDTGRKRGVLGFYIHQSLRYKQIDYHSDFECAVVEVCFNYNQYRNICLVYRPHINRMSHFLSEFENLLQFLRKLKLILFCLGILTLNVSSTHWIEQTTKTFFRHIITKGRIVSLHA